MLAFDITTKFKLTEDASSLFKDTYSVTEFISILRDNKVLIDAVKMYAHSLPVRYTVYWAYLCLLTELGVEKNPERLKLLDKTYSWVIDPNEKKRQEFKVIFDNLGLQDPIGCLAISIFWSGGSISGPDNPAVAAPPNAASETAANAIISRCIPFGGEMLAKLSIALDVGADVVSKKRHWS